MYPVSDGLFVGVLGVFCATLIVLYVRVKALTDRVWRLEADKMSDDMNVGRCGESVDEYEARTGGCVNGERGHGAI